MSPLPKIKQNHRRKARRSRRGVSMITVLFGLVVGAAVLVPVIEEVGRVQKRGLGQRMAEDASLFAQTWENAVRDCALVARKFDPSAHATTDQACATFPGLDYAAWATLNEGATVALQPVSFTSSGSHRVALKPFSVTNSGPVEILRGLTAQTYVASVAQESIATGFVVFTLADWIDPLTAATFKDVIELWTDKTVDGEEITTAMDAFRALHPTLTDLELAALLDRDVPAMTFSRYHVEPDWVLREPVVGAPGRMDGDLLLSSNLSNTASIEASGGTLTIARDTSVPSATGQIITSTADVFVQGTAQGLQTGSVTSGALSAGVADFALSLNADQLTTPSYMTARSVALSGTDGRSTLNAATGETAAAGALKADSLSTPSLRVGTTFVANAEKADGSEDYLRLQSVTASGSVIVSDEVLGSHLNVPSLITGSCAGC